MIKSKKVKIVICLFLISSISLLAYIFSFPDIEQVCQQNKTRETFLMNFVFKNDLKQRVLDHNKDFSPKDQECTRVYLYKHILDIPNPIILYDPYDYKPTGCDNIDIMDIYCIVDYSKSENGEIKAKYNFMTDYQFFLKLIFLTFIVATLNH